GLHAYGIALRWHIIGHIPVANMFEAVVSSAWVGVALALVLGLVFRAPVFVFAGALTGFMALILGSYIIPGQGTITSMMGILDDVMLRIHTVLIISSYALIFVAAVIAVVYLFQYYFYKAPGPSMFMGLTTMIAGGLLMGAINWLFVAGPTGASATKHPGVALGAGIAVVILVAVITLLSSMKTRAGMPIALLSLVAVVMSVLLVGNHDFVWQTGIVLASVGLFWAALMGAGMLLPAAQRNFATNAPMLATAGAFVSPTPATMRRPVMAGALPGDESRAKNLPAWLNQLDWCHLIILNMVFIMLFVGLILGAVWADYSWGRPWGWDPKEVFAMNTWIIYAILIHVRYVVKDRGLWTAWLSVAGCLMMAFNWCFVNFFIVGLHSYA
ncbi:MAG: cytochrome c biogenesis protein CcsA, partial [Phycisphaerales bacterium]|nr:cytochrome c biogenesis protein CcsA [Phycisphaerales bacterium]